MHRALAKRPFFTPHSPFFMKTLQSIQARTGEAFAVVENEARARELTDYRSTRLEATESHAFARDAVFAHGLHELAHAYHDQVLGFEEERLLDAWKKFCDSGKYEAVLNNSGQKHRHYGLTNQKEFFY